MKRESLPTQDETTLPAASCSHAITARDWILMAVILIAYFVLRLPYIGHLLAYDEAWTSLSIQALMRGEPSPFRLKFLRHPPLYPLLANLFLHSSSELAPKLQLLSLSINAGTLSLLFVLGRRIWGTGTALWIACAYALMPAAVFYDTWIKRDCLVSLFSVAAILAWTARRPVLSGVALGMSFLSKSTAIFYALSLGLMSLCPRPSRTQFLRLATVAGITVVLSAWWYATLSNSASHFLGFFSGGTNESQAFAEPWSFYFMGLYHNVGGGGLLIAAVGIVAILWHATTNRLPTAQDTLWPVLLLVPMFLLLSASHGKPSWLMIAALPALATIIGVGARHIQLGTVTMLVRTSKTGTHRCRPLWNVLIACVILALLGSPLASYESYFKGEAPASYSLSRMSKEVADAVRIYTTPEDRLLITTFSYQSQVYCPVFAYYADPRDIILREYTTSFEEMVRLIKEYQLDWAVLSPGQFPETLPLTQRFSALLDQRPVVLQGAVLFNTKQLHRSETSRPPEEPSNTGNQQ